MICKYCDSENVVKNRHVHRKQFYLCKNCGHKFVEPRAYPKMRTKGRVVATAIDLYFSGLSTGKVQSRRVGRKDKEENRRKQRQN